MAKRKDLNFVKVDFGDHNYEEFMLWYMSNAESCEIQLWFQMGMGYDWTPGTEEIEIAKQVDPDFEDESFMIEFTEEADLDVLQMWLSVMFGFDWELFHSKSPDIYDLDPMIERLK